MEITISDELWARIKQKVDSGAYPSVDVVLTNAMIHLEDHDNYVEEITNTPEVRAMIEEAHDDFRKGRYKEYSRENRDEFIEEIKQRALNLESESRKNRSS